MSYVGKILVLILVVMSILFMSFAGAVFQMHQNWQVKHAASELRVNDLTAQLTLAQTNLAEAKTTLTAKYEAAQQESVKFQAEAAGALTKIGIMQKQNDTLEQERNTQTGLAQSKADEARYRHEEAEKQRIENRKVQDRLDLASAENRMLKDQVFGVTTELEKLQKRFEEQQIKNAFLERVVRAHKLPTDPRVVERLELPPPPVDGVVSDVQMSKANRVQFVNVSIGSDDGLVVGHLLDVVRLTPDGTGKTEWLGQVKVVSIEPDSAVAEVVLAAKNGIIQEGDNVTTKL